jgi:hypothetical protein
VQNNKKKSWFFKLSVLHLLLAAAAAAHMGKHQTGSQAPTASSQKNFKKKAPLQGFSQKLSSRIHYGFQILGFLPLHYCLSRRERGGAME